MFIFFLPANQNTNIYTTIHSISIWDHEIMSYLQLHVPQNLFFIEMIRFQVRAKRVRLLLLSGKCSRLRAQFRTYFWLGKEPFSTIYSHTQKTHSDSSQTHEITLLHFTSVGSVMTLYPTNAAQNIQHITLQAWLQLMQHYTITIACSPFTRDYTEHLFIIIFPVKIPQRVGCAIWILLSEFLNRELMQMGQKKPKHLLKNKTKQNKEGKKTPDTNQKDNKTKKLLIITFS